MQFTVEMAHNAHAKFC